MDGHPPGITRGRLASGHPSILCHRSRDSRPAFVTDKYPLDKAFNYKPGDLRWMHAVYIPAVQAALAAQTPIS